MLKGGCILTHHRQPGETLISVMSRHTDNLGEIDDPRITADHFDLHWLELGPAPNAVGPYYRKEIKWDEFARLYMVRLNEHPPTVDRLAELIRRATEEDLVVLCIEETHEQCHRGLLLGHVATSYPELDVQFA